MDIAGNLLAVMHRGYWILFRSHSIETQNKHYFTSSAIKFYTNIIDKNALIKPSATTYHPRQPHIILGNHISSLATTYHPRQPQIIHIIFWS